MSKQEVMSQPPVFDYSQLDEDTCTFLLGKEAEMEVVLRRTFEELGRILLEVKARLPHGQYMPWLASKGISQQTAHRWMQIAQGKKPLKSPIMGDLQALASPEAVTNRPLSAYGFLTHWSDGQLHVYKPIDGVLLELDPSYATLAGGLWGRCEQMWTDTNFVTDEMREKDPIIQLFRKALDERIASGVPTRDHHGWLSVSIVEQLGCTYMERPFEEEGCATDTQTQPFK
jgi:hypothetical protein